jgi:hypothetical protein
MGRTIESKESIWVSLSQKAEVGWSYSLFPRAGNSVRDAALVVEASS